jgi:hypothetical protein
MSAFMVDTNTIDLIVQTAYKTKVISKRSRSLFGQALIQVNDIAMKHRYPDYQQMTALEIQDYEFTPFPRKYKRAAAAGAIACFMYQACEWGDYEVSQTGRLVHLAAEANARHAGYQAVTGEGGVLPNDNNVLQTAHNLYRAALSTQDRLVWWDITDDQRDPDLEDHDASVMVRPIAIIHAERAEERERIAAERMAAEALIVLADDVDDDDDDWDIDD